MAPLRTSTALAALIAIALGVGGASAAPLGQMQELPAVADATALVSGPDGNMWMVEDGGRSIGRLTPAGELTTFLVPDGAQLRDLTAGADGNLWYADAGRNAVGRVTPQGVITEFVQPQVGGSSPRSISAGPDGNIWFGLADPGGNFVGRLSTSGDAGALEFVGAGFALFGIEPGGASGLFFEKNLGNDVGAISTDLAVSSLPDTVQATGLVTAPDGRLWYTPQFVFGSGITPGVRVWSPATRAQVGDFPLPEFAVNGLTWGSDGNAWTGTVQGGQATMHRITPSGTVTSLATGLAAGEVRGFTPGPDGDVWFVRTGAPTTVVRMGTGAGAPVVAGVTGTAVAGTEHRCAVDTSGASLGTPTSLVRWTLDGATVDGATSTAYTPPASAVGKALRCVVRTTFSPSLVQMGVTSAARSLTVAPSPAPSPAAKVKKLAGTFRFNATTRVGTTTGTVPAGVTRITQAARTGGATAKRATGKCAITTVRNKKTRKVTKRTYRCTITLRKGSWTLTTTARGKAGVLAEGRRTVTVRR